MVQGPWTKKREGREGECSLVLETGQTQELELIIFKTEASLKRLQMWDLLELGAENTAVGKQEHLEHAAKLPVMLTQCCEAEHICLNPQDTHSSQQGLESAMEFSER